MLYFGSTQVAPIVEVGVATPPVSGFTGHVDEVGLRAIGWDDDDIAYFTQHYLCWNEEYDDAFAVPQENIDLYGTLTFANRNSYKNDIYYLPKIDTSEVTSFAAAFRTWPNLISVPKLDTSSVTNFESAFSYCPRLLGVAPMDFSAGTTFSSMFRNNASMRHIPYMNCENAQDMTLFSAYSACISNFNIHIGENLAVLSSAFYANRAITVLPLLDCTNVTSLTSCFAYCESLRYAKLNHVGVSILLSASNAFSVESLRYLINNAKTVTDQTMTLGATNLAKLTDDEIQIATDKGWTLV